MEAEKGEQVSTSSDMAERKKLLDQELARYVRLLKEHGAPLKVILFGTLARGNASSRMVRH